jgi:glutamine amidotransferase
VAKVVVLDYGSGNLRSAERALRRVGAEVEVTGDFDAAIDCDALVVPGVGAYAACMAGLREVKGERIIGRRLAGGRPVLGICVGMQILFERGIEHGVETEGCHQWPGTVDRLEADIVPHMGWNTVRAPEKSVLFGGLDQDTRFYFVHSYAARTWELHADDPAAGHLGRPRWRIRRRRRERPAVGHPVPPGEVRRRGRATPGELAQGRHRMTTPKKPAKPRKRKTVNRPTSRRRQSTATTLGGLVGAAVAGVLTGVLGSLPWWAWVLILLVGLGVGYLFHRRSTTTA